MISLSDILQIDNCILNTYLGYKWVKDNVPGYYSTGGHEHMEDLNFPEVKNIRYSDIHNIIGKIDENTPVEDLFLIPDYLQYGDYDSSSMPERSNYKTFIEDYGDIPGIYEIYGGNGSTGIAISVKWLLSPDNEDKAREIINLINGLNEYPVIDEELMSSMEYDAFIEAIDNYGSGDFISAMAKKFNLEIYDYDGEKVKDLILDINRAGHSEYYVIESDGSVYIDIERLIAQITTLDQLKPVLIDYEVLA